MAVRVKTKDDFPLDPDTPWLQTGLRYTATVSEHLNDMQIFPSSFSTPLGGDLFDEEGIRCTCMLELAQSAGEPRLNSNDPHEQMFINCRNLEHPKVRERTREGVRIISDMMEHESFNVIVEELISPMEADLASDETLYRWLLENVWIGQHLSGTCKMSSDSGEIAVVDQYGRVGGVQGPRVASPSIMPDCIRAKTNCTTIMIGERVANRMINQ